MASSFQFLKDNWPSLYKTTMLAESNLYDDPNTTIYKLGQFCEQVVLEIYHIEEIEDIPDNQNERIKKLQREGLLDNSIVSFLHAIRRMRNENVHDFVESTEDAIAAMKLSYRVAVWLEEVYGNPMFGASPYQIPEKKVEIDVSALEQEISCLKQQLEFKFIHDVPRKDTAQKMINASSRMIRDLSEEETRILIDEQLRQVGWKADTKRIRYSKGSRPQPGVNQAIAEWPTHSKYNKNNKGYVDYALFAGTKLLGFVEAKKKNLNIPSVLDSQCKDYASHVKKADADYIVGHWNKYDVPFIFATNGRNYNEKIKTQSGIWFQDLRKNTNLPKPLHGWPDANGLLAMLRVDEEEANRSLAEQDQSFLTSIDGLNLRSYQIRAVKAAEDAILAGQKRLLISMATGTGKTRTILGLVYSLLKAERFRRVLFLVDRRVLGDQAMDIFREVRIEDLETLDEIYNINTLKDLNIRENFSEARVQIATVQSMVKKLFSDGEEKPAVTDYDLIIVDEAHRGYFLDREMSDDELVFRDEDDYLSKYKYVIDYFDAVKVGLTATPALHTTDIFGLPVFNYSYREAVLDGYLVDHDAPYELETKMNTEGIVYRVGESLHVYDVDTNQVEVLPDIPKELEFEVEDFNRKIRTPGFNKAVLEEIAGYLDPIESRAKTLIFAANDEHADEIVQILREFYSDFDLDADAIMKITSKSGGGNRDKVAALVRQFKTERYPNIVVTVDLLTTGVDVPEICNLVFMRPVRSRILFEQMMGRATRLCPEIEKSHFDIFDPIGIYAMLQDFTDMKPVSANPKQTFSNLIDEMIALPENKGQMVDQVLARLERKIKVMSEEAKGIFQYRTGHTPQEFINMLREIQDVDSKVREITKYKETLEWLDTLKGGQKPRKVLYDDREDEVLNVKRGYGKGIDPEDYLESFEMFIEENQDKIEALRLICTKPKELTFNDLKSLKAILDSNQFTEQQLQSAYKEVNQTDMAIDLIGLIRHLAIHSNMVTHEQRVKDAIRELKKNHKFTPTQKKWLNQIQKVLLKDPILSKEMFDMGTFRNKGGFKNINKQFNDELDQIIDELNKYMYEDGGYYA